jgi:hypothetical protein
MEKLISVSQSYVLELITFYEQRQNKSLAEIQLMKAKVKEMEELYEEDNDLIRQLREDTSSMSIAFEFEPQKRKVENNAEADPTSNL